MTFNKKVFKDDMKSVVVAAAIFFSIIITTAGLFIFWTAWTNGEAWAYWLFLAFIMTISLGFLGKGLYSLYQRWWGQK